MVRASNQGVRVFAGPVVLPGGAYGGPRRAKRLEKWQYLREK